MPLAAGVSGPSQPLTSADDRVQNPATEATLSVDAAAPSTDDDQPGSPSAAQVAAAQRAEADLDGFKAFLMENIATGKDWEVWATGLDTFMRRWKGATTAAKQSMLHGATPARGMKPARSASSRLRRRDGAPAACVAEAGSRLAAQRRPLGRRSTVTALPTPAGVPRHTAWRNACRQTVRWGGKECGTTARLCEGGMRPAESCSVPGQKVT